MSLDFSLLDALPQKTAQKAIEEDFKDLDEEIPTDTLKGLKMASTGLTEGIAKEDHVEEAVEGLKVVALGDIRKSRELQASIVQGIKAGVPEYTLLLQAVEAIALLTGEKEYYSQIRESILTIHGEGLEKQLPLEWLLQDIQEDLKKIRATLKRKNLKPDTRRELEEAVIAHELREKEVQAKLDEARQLKLDFRQ